MIKLSLTIAILVAATQSAGATVTIPLDRLNQFKKACVFSVKHNNHEVKEPEKACDCMAQQLSVYASKAQSKDEVRKSVDYAIRFFQPSKLKANPDLDAILADWGDRCTGVPEIPYDQGTPPSDDK